MLALAALLAAGATGVWTAVAGGAFLGRFGLGLMVAAGLIALAGGTLLSRSSTLDVRAFLGAGPEMDPPAEGEGLTSVGVFLFVCVPLFALGAVVHGGG